MKKNPSSQSGLFNPRAFVAFTLCSVGVLLAMVSFAAPASKHIASTFGHPIITGIGGVGFEQGVRVDPSNANRLYTSVPGSLSSDTRFGTPSTAVRPLSGSSAPRLLKGRQHPALAAVIPKLV